MAKKVTLSVKEYDKLIKKFGSLLSQIERELNRTHMHFVALMNGDANGPYWNGPSAIKFYKLARLNFDKNVVAYNALLKVYDKLVQLRNDLKYYGLIVAPPSPPLGHQQIIDPEPISVAPQYDPTRPRLYANQTNNDGVYFADTE